MEIHLKTKEEIIAFVDGLFHMYASWYRMEAKQKLTEFLNEDVDEKDN